MYSINGVALDNEDFGWSVLRRSQPLTSVSSRGTDVRVPGRRGALSVPSDLEPPTTTFVVRTPGENLETLYALVLQPNGVLSLTDDATRYAAYDQPSLSPEGINARDALVNVSITLRLFEAAWNDSSVTTGSSISITASPQTITLLPGISADVYDLDFFISGPFSTFTLTDSSGAWLGTAKTWAGTGTDGLFYSGSLGRAFSSTTADPFNPGADVSDYLDTSGGKGFRITPYCVGGDPSNREGHLTLVTGGHSSVKARFRTRGAYALRNGDV